ncbi:MAG: hypothetical protein M3Q33_05895, partial [Acidobacteriota bacterium]|nr:hypothetical protein [Acidobacteriota bacterium]
NTINVKAGGDFQAALNRAKAGDTILLQAGAAFSGNFNLPNKPGNEFITIRTSVRDAQIPPADKRLEPAEYAGVLPKLTSPNAEPVITAIGGAHHYRFIGVEFGATKDGVGNIVNLGTTEEKRVEDLPHHIEFDRVYIHGSPTSGQRRGIAANGRNIKISNSHISDIKRKGEESQAIAVWASDGPIEIVNNYLEAAAENILFGGAESFLKLTPTDCVIRDNFLNKPLNWREEGWVVKNLFEIKHGRRIKIDNNLMTNNWGMAQDGTAILFTTREDGGKDAVIEDIEFTNNIVRGSGNAVSVYGGEGGGGHHLTLRNNIFADINGAKWNGAGNFMKSTAWDGLVIENNTILQSGNIASAYGEPVKNFVFRNNIVFENEYGIKGDGIGSGQKAIIKFFSNGTVADNIIVSGKAALYREENFYLTSIKQIGFINAEAGDYRLQNNSPYLKKGFGGKQIGANLNSQTVGRK